MTRNRTIVLKNGVEPRGGGGPFNSWQGWVLEVVVSLILPFWKNKWGPFLALKNIGDMVEKAAEVTEDVAERVEKMADKIGNSLPGGGKLKGVFDLIENVAGETAKDAHLVDRFIEKVEDKVESVYGVLLPNNYQPQPEETEVVDEPINAQEYSPTSTT